MSEMPDNPANLRRDHLSPKKFSADLVPGIRWKRIVKNLNKRTIPIVQKNIANSDFFGLWSRSFVTFFQDTFAAYSRDQICGKKFFHLSRIKNFDRILNNIRTASICDLWSWFPWRVKVLLWYPEISLKSPRNMDPNKYLIYYLINIKNISKPENLFTNRFWQMVFKSLHFKLKFLNFM